MSSKDTIEQSLTPSISMLELNLQKTGRKRKLNKFQSKEQLKSLQNDIIQAANIIHNLKNQKIQLKNALDQLQYKNDIYNSQVKQYKDLFNNEVLKNQKLTEKLDLLMQKSDYLVKQNKEMQVNLDKSYTEIKTLKSAMQKLLDNNDNDKILQTSETSTSERSQQNYKIIYQLLHKMQKLLREIPRFNTIWTTCNQNLPESIQNFPKLRIIQILVKFINKLTKAQVSQNKPQLSVEIPHNQSSYQDYKQTPSSHYSGNSFQAFTQENNYTYIMQNSDKVLDNLRTSSERINQLNQQIKDTVTSTRRILNSPKIFKSDHFRLNKSDPYIIQEKLVGLERVKSENEVRKSRIPQPNLKR